MIGATTWVQNKIIIWRFSQAFRPCTNLNKPTLFLTDRTYLSNEDEYVIASDCMWRHSNHQQVKINRACEFRCARQQSRHIDTSLSSSSSSTSLVYNSFRWRQQVTRSGRTTQRDRSAHHQSQHHILHGCRGCTWRHVLASRVVTYVGWSCTGSWRTETIKAKVCCHNLS